MIFMIGLSRRRAGACPPSQPLTVHSRPRGHRTLDFRPWTCLKDEPIPHTYGSPGVRVELLLLRKQRYPHEIVRVEVRLRGLLDRRGVEFLVKLRELPDRGGIFANLVFK